MWSSNRFPYLAVGQVVQANLAAIGIKVEFVPMEYNAFVSFTGNSPPGILIWAWELGYPSGSYIVDSAFTTTAQKEGCCNYPWYSSHNVDQLAVDAHRSTNPGDIVGIYKQIDKIIVQEQVLWVPLIYPTRLDLRQRTGAGFPGVRGRRGRPAPVLLQIRPDVTDGPTQTGGLPRWR